ncbi:hypothetical protein DAMA08_051260 [Martiniozyma asiatica (nom. inval.)]|nr:hypothetical protein DAMA08_051260 [Martiniozyma asiatica]
MVYLGCFSLRFNLSKLKITFIKMKLSPFGLTSMMLGIITASDNSMRIYSTYSPDIQEIKKDATNASTTQWKSDVKGKAFDRFVVIWLENTNFDQAAEEPHMAWLAEQGITLTNYWALTHPSEPNYMASVGGDYFEFVDDDADEMWDRFVSIPSNVSTIVDLLDDKGISWGAY